MRLKDGYPLWLSFVFFVAVGTHIDTVQYWFAATDTLALIETSRVQSTGDAVALFTQPLMAGSDFVTVALFYRPISSLSFALDYSLWGLNPFGYHLTNVLLHALTAVLVAVTIAVVTDRRAVGYLSALLFAVHPLTVGVVPAISRRQDILLAIFVLCALLLLIRSRRHNRRRLLSGALLAYALALGAKETAVVLPGLVFAWVAIHHETEGLRPALTRGVVATVPFVFVTGIYLVVRLLVLGGLGGYRDVAAPDPGIAVLFVPVKYLLWVAQPTNAVGSAVASLPRAALLVVLTVGAVCAVALARWLRLHRRLGTPGRFTLAVSGVGFGTVFAGLAFAARVEKVVPTGVSEANAVVRYLIGALFVGGCLVGLLVAARIRSPSFDTVTRRSLLFFLIWVVAVPGLLMVTGAGIGNPLQIGDQIQTGYLCIIPAMAGLSVLVFTAGESLVGAYRSDALRLDANVALMVLTVALLVPLVATSPLIQPYDEWQQAGELNQRMLTELHGELDETPPAATVYVLDLPAIESDDPPLASSVKPLKTYSVEAWLGLHDPPPHREIGLVGSQTLQRAPAHLSLETERTNGAIVVRVRHSGRETRPPAPATGTNSSSSRNEQSTGRSQRSFGATSVPSRSIHSTIASMSMPG